MGVIVFAKAGFYTNRIPAVAMHAMFKATGFKIIQEGFGKWLTLPARRGSMHANYQKYSDADLLNRTSHVC